MPVVVGQVTPWNEEVCTLKSQKAPAGGSRTFTRRFKNLELTDLRSGPIVIPHTAATRTGRQS